MNVYCGFDQREAAGFHTFMQSLVEYGSLRGVTALSGEQGDGTNTFTYERFRVPEMETWAGRALFLDAADMLLLTSLDGLFSLYDSRYAVQVVKHDYKTKHRRKYRGTEMEADNQDYERKNWSSLILWNCAHRAHFKARQKIREAIKNSDGAYLHRFGWLQDDEIGELPPEWNWLVDEYGPNPEAKLLHWTAGIPGIRAYNWSPSADKWFSAKSRSSETPAERRIAEIASAR
jgi:hypothetical protein